MVASFGLGWWTPEGRFGAGAPDIYLWPVGLFQPPGRGAIEGHSGNASIQVEPCSAEGVIWGPLVRLKRGAKGDVNDRDRPTARGVCPAHRRSRPGQYPCHFDGWASAHRR